MQRLININLSLLVLSLLLLSGYFLPGEVAEATVVDSKHDLRNMGGSDPNKEICVFCHTPHNANPQIRPLWNKTLTSYTSFLMYSSDTMDTANASTPSMVSLACLSCHDVYNGDNGGVNAGDGSEMQWINKSNIGSANYVGCLKCHTTGGFKPQDWWQIGADLTNDHPVSMTYPTAAQDNKFNTPPSLSEGWSDIRLYHGKVECPSCHNPHDTTNWKFLRKSNRSSLLCLTCHIK